MLQAVHLRPEYADGTKAGMPFEGGLNGRPKNTLPLFGSETLATCVTGCTVIVTEGEKDALSLRERGFHAVGSVTGAHDCPVPEVLDILRPFNVVYWPDNDDQGRAHMRRMAAIIPGSAIVWSAAPESAGAADFTGDVQALIDSAEPPNPICSPTKHDRKAAKLKLANALEYWQGPEKAAAVSTCRTWFRRYRCQQDESHHPALPDRCRHFLCPDCTPRSVNKYFRDNYNFTGFQVFKLRSIQPYESEEHLFETIGKRFAKWRHAKLLNCSYGLRLESTDVGLRPVIMATIPPGDTMPDGGRAFDIEPVIGSADQDEIGDWFAEQYVEEVVSCQSQDDFGVLLNEAMGRRRIRHFGQDFQKGGLYRRIERDEIETPPIASNPPPSGGRKKQIHCWCGSPCDPEPVGYHHISEIEELPNDKWRWKGIRL